MEETNEYLRAVKRLWPIIVIATLLGMAAAFFATPAQVSPLLRTYRATHTMLLNGDGGQVATVTFKQLPLFATTGEVPRRVAAKVKWTGAPATLATQIQAAVDVDTGTFTISTAQVDPARAVLLADTFAKELVTYLAQRQDEVQGGRLAVTLKRLNELKKQATDLDTQVQGDPPNEVLKAQRDAAVRQYGAQYDQYQGLVAQAAAGIGLTTLEKAQPVPVENGGFTVPRSRKARVPLAGAVGAMLGLGLALVMDRFDGRVRDRKQAELLMGAPVVAELSTLNRNERGLKLCVSPEHQGGVAEGYRTLRTALTFLAGAESVASSDGPSAPVILVSSPSPGDGKTTTAANVAAAFAEAGSRVLVVNADFRRPKISSFFVANLEFGVGMDLATVSALTAQQVLIPTENPAVSLIDLSRVHAAPGELARVTARAVAAMRNEVDAIVIDTPPLGVTAEALEFVAVASMVLLIGRVGRTRVRSADRACELVRFIGATTVVVALTDTGHVNRGRSQYDGTYALTPDVRTKKQPKQAKDRSAATTKPAKPQARKAPPVAVRYSQASPLPPASVNGNHVANGKGPSGVNPAFIRSPVSAPPGSDNDDDDDDDYLNNMDEWDD